MDIVESLLRQSPDDTGMRPVKRGVNIIATWRKYVEEKHFFELATGFILSNNRRSSSIEVHNYTVDSSLVSHGTCR